MSNVKMSWKLARFPDVIENGEEISKKEYALSDKWINAVVPGTVLYSYEKAGLIDDPYFSDNILKLDQDYYNVDYWYRGEIDVPVSYTGKTIWLDFDGVNHKADVFVNGVEAGKVYGAFRRGHIDVTDLVTPGETAAVAVHIHWCDGNLMQTPTFIGSGGWDFMPAIPGRNIGIYAPVSIVASGCVTVRNTFVKTDLKLPEMDSVKINISTELENISDKDVICVLSGKIQPSGTDISKTVPVPAGQTVTVKMDAFTLKNPQIWWPVGYGKHPIYKLELAAAVNGTVSAGESVDFGIRKVEYDRDGHDLTLTVNGVRVLCKGGNWGMPDAMLKHTARFMDDSVRLHAEAGVNMIRTWHSNSDFDSFYNACDKYGVMVFEDFALHGKQLPDEPMLFMESARDKLKRLRNRCCIVLWCGENEAVPPAPLDVLLPEAVNELDGTRLYIAASNCDGVHGGTTYMIQDPAWFFGHAKGFVTEIGTQTVPNIESMRRMMKEEELWPAGNPVWQHHDYNFGIGNKNSQKYTDEVNARYGKTDNIEDFCKKAQLVNVETYKAIFESYNDEMFDECSGLLLWMSAPAWPSLIWEIYDWYLDCFGAFYGTKKATEMRHIQWNARTGAVKAINHLSIPFNGRVEAEVYNMDGTLKFKDSKPVFVKGADKTTVMSLFADTAVNIAVGKKGSASGYEKDCVADNAFDGNDITRWTCDGSDKGWLCVDLGEAQAIDGVRISWENAYAKDYHIEVSTDGVNYTKVAEMAGGNGGLNTLMFDAVEARYVKLVCTARGTMWNYSCYQFMVFAAGTSEAGIDGLSKVHFIKLKMYDDSGKLVSDNFYWRSKVNCDCRELQNIGKTTVSVAASGKNKGTVTLKNTGDNVAVSVRVKAAKTQPDERGDDRILPVFMSENYVCLLPGESREITYEYAPDVYSGDLKLVVGGMNTNEITLTVK